MLAIYNHNLDERERRKDFVLEQGLLSGESMHSKGDRKWGREEKELHRKLDIFARFSQKEEHAKFVKDLLNEMQLRRKITNLQGYRKLGIRTHAEIEQYENDLKMRTDEQRSRSYRSNHRFGQRGARDEPHAEMFFKKKGVGGAAAKAQQTALQNQNIELLSKHEQEMCRVLKLLPAQYLVCKSGIIREGLKGPVKKSTVRSLLNIEAPKVNKLFDFMAQAGWIEAAKTNARKATVGFSVGSLPAGGKGAAGAACLVPGGAGGAGGGKSPRKRAKATGTGRGGTGKGAGAAGARGVGAAPFLPLPGAGGPPLTKEQQALAGTRPSTVQPGLTQLQRYSDGE